MFSDRTSVLSRRAVLKAGLALPVAIGLGACSAETASGGSGNGPVRVAFFKGMGTLPIRVAETRGLFSHNGLEVVLTEGTDIATWQLALGKQFDIAFTNAAFYTPSVGRGARNSIIGNLNVADAKNPTTLLVSTDELASLADLRGASIGTAALTSPSTIGLKYLLQKAGLSESDYQFVQVPYPNSGDMLKAGKIQASLSAHPYFEQLRADRYHVYPGDPVVEALSAATDGRVNTWSSSMFAARTDWAHANMDKVDAWTQSMGDAIAWINSNEEQARSILQEWTSVSTEVAATTALPTYTTEIFPDELPALWSVMQDTGNATGDFPSRAVDVIQNG